MKTLTMKDFVNENTINIFVDASIIQIKDDYIGCPGYCVVEYANNEIQSRHHEYLTIGTNSRAELKAILLGMAEAVTIVPLKKKINLFSDSKFALFSIREWIFNWIDKIRNGELYNSSDKPVMHQDVMLAIISTILGNDIDIRLYHQKGHVDEHKQASLEHAQKVFKDSNKVDIDLDVVKFISRYNNEVDINTKNFITTNIKGYHCKYPEGSCPIKFSFDQDYDKYKTLIKGESKSWNNFK